VDGFVRTVDAFRSECWTGSDRNGGRHQIRTPGRHRWNPQAVSLSFATAALAVSALVVRMAPLLQDAGMSTTAAARTVSIIGLGI
jgi:hypothetical protein